MTTRVTVFTLAGWIGLGVALHAQIDQPGQPGSLASRYVDPVAGLNLQDAIVRALEQEPDLRSARTGVDVARGMRQQAQQRPNPMVSFSQQEETGDRRRPFRRRRPRAPAGG